MNAEAITNRILEEARKQAADTLREAEKRAEALHCAADQAGEDARVEAKANAERQVDALRERMLRMAELEQKKLLLGKKRDLIDQAFEDALTRMRKMPDGQKRTLIQRLILEASENGETLIPDEGEQSLYDGAFLAKVNAALEQTGRKPVALGKTARKLGGGFVLQNAGLEINCTYDSVLAQMRPGLEASVADRLFGEK